MDTMFSFDNQTYVVNRVNGKIISVSISGENGNMTLTSDELLALFIKLLSEIEKHPLNDFVDLLEISNITTYEGFYNFCSIHQFTQQQIDYLLKVFKDKFDARFKDAQEESKTVEDLNTIMDYINNLNDPHEFVNIDIVVKNNVTYVKQTKYNDESKVSKEDYFGPYQSFDMTYNTFIMPLFLNSAKKQLPKGSSLQGVDEFCSNYYYGTDKDDHVKINISGLTHTYARKINDEVNKLVLNKNYSQGEDKNQKTEERDNVNQLDKPYVRQRTLNNDNKKGFVSVGIYSVFVIIGCILLGILTALLLV